jgi:hypothetical protein
VVVARGLSSTAAVVRREGDGSGGEERRGMMLVSHISQIWQAMGHVTWTRYFSIISLVIIKYKLIKLHLESTKNENIPAKLGGIHGVQTVYLESIWSPGGLQVDFGKYLAGPPAKGNPHGLQVDSTSPCGVQWSPGGFYGGG